MYPVPKFRATKNAGCTVLICIPIDVAFYLRLGFPQPDRDRTVVLSHESVHINSEIEETLVVVRLVER